MNSKILCCYVLLMLAPLVILQRCGNDDECNGEDAVGPMCCKKFWRRCGNMTGPDEYCGFGLGFLFCPCMEGHKCVLGFCKPDEASTTEGSETTTGEAESGGSAE